MRRGGDSPRRHRRGRAAGLCGGRCGSGPSAETPRPRSRAARWSSAAPEDGKRSALSQKKAAVLLPAALSEPFLSKQSHKRQKRRAAAAEGQAGVKKSNYYFTATSTSCWESQYEINQKGFKRFLLMCLRIKTTWTDSGLIPSGHFFKPRLSREDEDGWLSQWAPAEGKQGLDGRLARHVSVGTKSCPALQLGEKEGFFPPCTSASCSCRSQKTSQCFSAGNNFYNQSKLCNAEPLSSIKEEKTSWWQQQNRSSGGFSSVLLLCFAWTRNYFYLKERRSKGFKPASLKKSALFSEDRREREKYWREEQSYISCEIIYRSLRFLTEICHFFLLC